MSLTVDAAVRALHHDQRLLLVNERTGRCYHGTGTAVQAWQALVETGDRDDAASRIAERYGVHLDRARRDLADFLDRLLAAELVHEETP